MSSLRHHHSPRPAHPTLTLVPYMAGESSQAMDVDRDGEVQGTSTGKHVIQHGCTRLIRSISNLAQPVKSNEPSSNKRVARMLLKGTSVVLVCTHPCSQLFCEQLGLDTYVPLRLVIRVRCYSASNGTYICTIYYVDRGSKDCQSCSPAAVPRSAVY